MGSTARRFTSRRSNADRAMLAGAPVALAGSIAATLCSTPAHAAEEHTVAPGDTVTGIAIRNGLRAADVIGWNDLDPRATIVPGQTLRLSPPVPAAPAAGAAADVHVVEAGDTVWSIAQRYGTTVEALLAANGLSAAATIYPGQELKLTRSPAPAAGAVPATTPSVGGTVHVVRPGETVWGIARQHGVSVQAVLSANGLGDAATIHPGQELRIGAAPAAAPAAAVTPAPQAPAKAEEHVVGPGDTLWSIARQHDTSVAELLRANGLDGNAIIYPGQALKLRAPEPAEDPNAQRWATLDAEQVGNARLIIEVGREIGASDRAIATALATAMVESSLRNIDGGDRDSLGLFQQRPSQGWGTPEQIMDPVRSTKVFFGGSSDPNGHASRGLHDVGDWQAMSFGDAAQAVQISAYPHRYGQWEQQAYAWLAALG